MSSVDAVVRYSCLILNYIYVRSLSVDEIVPLVIKSVQSETKIDKVYSKDR